MKKSLESALPIAEGISKLLFPFGEVVVHDLESDSIFAIYNPISRREVGDSSYLDRIDFGKADQVIGPYEKINWDGRKLKCISIVLRNARRAAEGFICINLDISAFDGMQRLVGQFLNNGSTMSTEEQRLFKDDLYEKINSFVQGYCLKQQVALDSLGREQRKNLISALQEQGAFREKNAATYIGRILGVSRATVYNYLKGEE